MHVFGRYMNPWDICVLDERLTTVINVGAAIDPTCSIRTYSNMKPALQIFKAAYMYRRNTRAKLQDS
jgi:hypothetical protein